MLLPSSQPPKLATELNAGREEPLQELQEPDLQTHLTAVEEEADKQAELSADSSQQAGVADDSAYFEVADELKAAPEPEHVLDSPQSLRRATFEATRSKSTSIISDSEPDKTRALRDLSPKAVEHSQAASVPRADARAGLKEPGDAIAAEVPQVDRSSSPHGSLAASVSGVTRQQDSAPNRTFSPRVETRAFPTSSLVDVSLATQLSSSQERSLSWSEGAIVNMNAAIGAGGWAIETRTMLEPVGEHVEGGAAPRYQKKARFAEPFKVEAEVQEYLETEQGASVYLSASQPVQGR